MRYNRERLEIAYDILEIIKNTPRGAKPTHILYKANLSPTLLQRYLAILLEDGLIQRDEVKTRSIYTITEKGIRLIEILKSIDRMTSIINLLDEQRTKVNDQSGRSQNSNGE